MSEKEYLAPHQLGCVFDLFCGVATGDSREVNLQLPAETISGILNLLCASPNTISFLTTSLLLAASYLDLYVPDHVIRERALLFCRLLPMSHRLVDLASAYDHRLEFYPPYSG